MLYNHDKLSVIFKNISRNRTISAYPGCTGPDRRCATAGRAQLDDRSDTPHAQRLFALAVPRKTPPRQQRKKGFIAAFELRVSILHRPCRKRPNGDTPKGRRRETGQRADDPRCRKRLNIRPFPCPKIRLFPCPFGHPFGQHDDRKGEKGATSPRLVPCRLGYARAGGAAAGRPRDARRFATAMALWPTVKATTPTIIARARPGRSRPGRDRPALYNDNYTEKQYGDNYYARTRRGCTQHCR